MKLEGPLTEEFVGNNERFVGLEESWVRDTGIVLRVVEKLVPTEIPAPALFVVTHQALVSDTVKGCLCGRDAHYGVRASLPRAPEQFPDMHTFRVPYSPSYAVCALGHRVPVKR